MIDGVAMGSPLNPVAATFYMEKLEELSISSTPLKPRRWFRYADNTFLVWNHGEEESSDISWCTSTVFTVEKEADDQLAFLNILILRTIGSLGQKYTGSQCTPTDPCTSCPIVIWDRRGQFEDLGQQSKRICEPRYLNEDLGHLKQSLQTNGYSVGKVKHTVRLRSARPPELVSQGTVGFAVLP